ncbi:Catechol 2,3-dioxygenase [Devosia enhydra]|uniref:Catechol 2,3-dioxygenase n=1 Tax=Devosia enhydra TaxID=665118 RepID=A0A1K2I230_9HYPH|nr:VOC family protein [Devosia enhydra]SFZ86450.1 Catechol 2,3-dioxygenase [Devosia enhydra]
MPNRVAMVSLLVPDYESGVAFYRDRLGFRLVTDTPLGDGKRWVVVEADSGARLLLAMPGSPEQAARIGDQTGGRVGFFLETDDFAATHARFLAAGVAFREAPRHEPYGSVAVFADPFGNLWDLIEPAKAADNTG